MKRKHISTLLFFFFLIPMMKSQVGINTNNPKATLHVAGNVLVENIPIGSNAKAKTSNSPTYVLTTGESGIITKVKIGEQLKANKKRIADSLNIISGSVGVLYHTDHGGKLDSTKVINRGLTSYHLDNLNSPSPKVGGIDWVEGKGYRISNPEPGVFDIEYDTPFFPLSITANIVDNYSSDTTDNKPNPSVVGNRITNEYDIIIKYNLAIQPYKTRLEIVKVGSKEKANLSFSFTAIVEAVDFY